MVSSADVAMLIRRGGVIKNVEGETLKDVYDYVAARAKLPEGVTAEVFSEELYMREQVLSTAVGNSIAIPHPRRTLFKDPEDERIIVCYLKQPMDMHAPDSFSVILCLSFFPARHSLIWEYFLPLQRFSGIKILYAFCLCSLMLSSLSER